MKTEVRNQKSEVSVLSSVFCLYLAAAALMSPVIAQQPFDSLSLAQGRQTNAPRTAAAPAPRTADGKPDLSGFWRGPLLRNMDKNVPGGFKAIFTPAGAAAYERNRTKTINPEGVCLFAGVPRASISGVPFQIVQAPTRVAFLYELMWTFRSIPVDGRRLPAEPEPSFFGTSAGRWEKDVFVIESRGFKEHQSWLDDDAHPHSEGMTLVERWWRPDAGHLAHEVTVTDPAYYNRPFTFDRVFEHMPAGQELIEFACNENNKDLPRLGFGPHEPEIYDKPAK
jgi:hypothetical protein